MKTSACRDGILKNHAIKLNGNDTTTPSPHLVPFHQLCFVFLVVRIGGLWKAVGCVSSAGCVVHVDLRGERVMLWMAGMWLLYSIICEFRFYEAKIQ